MKDSGVESLGMVPQHWEIEQLGRIGAFSKGSGGTKEDETTEGVPCIRYGDLYTKYDLFVDNVKSYISEDKAVNYTPIQYGDVLFAGSGETIEDIGKSAVNLLRDSVYCAGDVIIFRPSIKLNAKFFGFVTGCPYARYQKSCMGRGITIMHIYASELKYLTVPIPPIPEQVAIARYLDYVDVRVRRLTEAKRKLIGLLTEYKQAIVHRAVTRGLDPNVPLKDSSIEWLGMVPQHWEVRQFRTLATGFNNGTATDQLVSGESDYLVSRIETISKGIVDYSKVGYIASDHLVQAHYLKENDFLISHINSYAKVGNSARYDGAQPLLHGMNLIRVTPRDCVNSHFLGYLLKSQVFIGSMQRACKPAINQVSVTTIAMKAIILPLPPLPEQVAIVEYLDRTTAEIDIAVARAKRQIELLNEYRTRLIADVVTGKLDVRDATLDPEEIDR